MSNAAYPKTAVKTAANTSVKTAVITTFCSTSNSDSCPARSLHAARPGRLELAPLSLEYTDFALWESDQLNEQGLEYWTSQLAGAPSLIAVSRRTRQ